MTRNSFPPTSTPEASASSQPRSTARRSLLNAFTNVIPLHRRTSASPLLHPESARRPSTPTGQVNNGGPSSRHDHHLTPGSLASPSASAASAGDSPDLSAPPQAVSYSPSLLYPTLPYARTDRADSNVSSRRSSFVSDADPAGVPGAPVAGVPPPLASGRAGTSVKGNTRERPMSLSVNYVPAKFTGMHMHSIPMQTLATLPAGKESFEDDDDADDPDDGTAPAAHKSGGGTAGKIRSGLRRRRKDGGGRAAFGASAERMGIMGMVDDDEGVEYKMARGGVKQKGRKVLRWNRFKAALFAANTVLMLYGLVTLVAAILVWLNVFSYADVIRVGNKVELIVSTIAAALCTLTALFGYSGILLNNRAFLAVYTLLLWIDLGFIAAPGYMTYKQRTFNLEGKLNQQWSRYLGTAGRLRIQDSASRSFSLICCGYYSPFIEASQSPLCYARSNLPGCKGRYLHLERGVLHIWYSVAFGIVGAHILIIVTALLCSNHVTYRFGKGLTPKRYRLDVKSMGVILGDYANQIAAQYGDGAAQEALSRSVSRVSADPSPHRQKDSLVDIATPRRNSFAAPGAPVFLEPRNGNANGTITTTSTGYNSQSTDPDSPAHDFGAAPRAPGGVRLVARDDDDSNNRNSYRDSGAPDGWRYRDADEGDADLDRMEVSTGYSSSGPRDRNSVGWAQ